MLKKKVAAIAITLAVHGTAHHAMAGKRFFAEGTPPRSFELVSTKALASGVIISMYNPNGPLRTGTMGV